MKKTMTLFLIALGTSTTYAQKKPAKPAAPAAPAKPAAVAPAAKPAEPVKPVATAPAVAPAPAPAPEPKKGGMEIRALAWGGYNFPSSSAFNGSTSGVTKGGISGGGEFTLGTSFIQAGVAVSYVSLWSQTVIGASGSYNFNVLPLEGVINILPFGGLYLGARGGYVLDIGSTSITGTTYTKTNGFSVGGQLGYIFDLGPVGIDVGAIFSYMEFTLNVLNTPPVTNTYKDIIPRIGVNIRF